MESSPILTLSFFLSCQSSKCSADQNSAPSTSTCNTAHNTMDYLEGLKLLLVSCLFCSSNFKNYVLHRWVTISNLVLNRVFLNIWKSKMQFLSSVPWRRKLESHTIHFDLENVTDGRTVVQIKMAGCEWRSRCKCGLQFLVSAFDGLIIWLTCCKICNTIAYAGQLCGEMNL